MYLPGTFSSPSWTTFCHRRGAPAPNNFHGPSLCLFQQTHIFLLLGNPDLDAVFWQGLIRAEYRGTTPSLSLWARFDQTEQMSCCCSLSSQLCIYVHLKFYHLPKADISQTSKDLENRKSNFLLQFNFCGANYWAIMRLAQDKYYCQTRDLNHAGITRQLSTKKTAVYAMAFI